MNISKSKWGLVLSGGAAWGLANGGVIEVLEKNDLKPDVIAGSSMGAIVGALYACGYGSRELKQLCKELKLINIARFSRHTFTRGLHEGFLQQNLAQFLEPLIGGKRIKDCDIPFVCIAGRIKQPIKWHRIINRGFTAHALTCVEEYVFPADTTLLDAVMATSAIPVLFSPVKIGDDEFVDLCNFGAIPSRTLRSMHNPDIVIGTDTSPRHKYVRRILPGPWKTFLDTSNASLEASKKACNLIIEPSFKVGPMRFDRAMELYEAGVTATEQRITEIQSLLSASS